ncbi:hypothetical protein GPA10_11080 [Streptomyces sp. p1417]|uniref:Uncharacterized protein n=1 Tax=Streptomyces typhae TaxID=2681492 RepID=A0A6L6WSQ5_9ACTN|nr:hypothetical protein [Streptomyces typhae]MVO85282.1 hypothetical protein [Streptomyces typhae]
MPSPRSRRAVLTHPLALVYLALCAGLLVWALVVSSIDTPDASMAGVVPVLATAPASLILLVLPEHSAMFIVSVAVGALANAAVIGWCARTLSRHRNGPGSGSGA